MTHVSMLCDMISVLVLVSSAYGVHPPYRLIQRTLLGSVFEFPASRLLGASETFVGSPNLDHDGLSLCMRVALPCRALPNRGLYMIGIFTQLNETISNTWLPILYARVSVQSPVAYLLVIIYYGHILLVRVCISNRPFTA